MISGFENLRVLLVGPVPPPHGGMANQTLQLAALLRREGATVELAVVNAPYRPRWVGRFPLVRAGFRLVPFLGHLYGALGRADIVHVMASSGWIWHLSAAPAVWLARIRRVPVVVNYRGGGAAEFFRRAMFWVRPTLNRCTTIVVPSPFLERVFRSHGFPTTVIPNIIDLTRFAPAATPPAPRRFPPGPHLVVARNLEPVYDIGTALRAFRLVRERMPEARLTVAGSGVSGPSLVALASDLGLGNSIVFSGRLENDAMATLLRTADLVLNPSLVDNMPISILEALASGVPVVSTNVGGIPDLVTDGATAVLVPPGNAEAMGEAAVTLLSNPDRMKSLILAGLERVLRFTWDRVGPELLEAYRGAGARSTPSAVR